MKKTETLMLSCGEILREDFMKPLGLTVNKLALELHVPAFAIICSVTRALSSVG